MALRNILSVDVEDYFHPSEVQRSVDHSRWDSLPSRVSDATAEVIDLLAGSPSASPPSSAASPPPAMRSPATATPTPSSTTSPPPNSKPTPSAPPM
jgi:hypothetical protein